jgi:hypothetical protein
MNAEVADRPIDKTGIGAMYYSTIDIAKSMYPQREIMKTGERTRDEWAGRSTRSLLREYHKLFKTVKEVGTMSRLRRIAKEISKRMSELLHKKAQDQVEGTYKDVKGVTARSLGASLQFGRVDKAVIKALRDDDIMWDAYKGLGTDLSQRLNKIIDESFRLAIRPTMDEIRGQMEEVVDLNQSRIENIVRTETARVANVSKMHMYDEYDPEGERTYTWRGPPWDPRRSSKHCQWIKRQIAREGGSVPLRKMRELWKEASIRFNGPKWRYRDGVPHPRCRHVLEVVPL